MHIYWVGKVSFDGLHIQIESTMLPPECLISLNSQDDYSAVAQKSVCVAPLQTGNKVEPTPGIDMMLLVCKITIQGDTPGADFPPS